MTETITQQEFDFITKYSKFITLEKIAQAEGVTKGKVRKLVKKMAARGICWEGGCADVFFSIASKLTVGWKISPVEIKFAGRMGKKVTPYEVK